MLPILTPTDFVALVNQTLEFAYPSVEIEGEVKNFKVSRGRWVYFDIADDISKIRCFGTVYMLPAPVEDGMKVRITAVPRMHPQFGFSLNISNLQFSGEGTIKKAADLLRAKLEAEGLFREERKRSLPYPPARIGLIASGESAGYKDFIKVLSARFGGIDIDHADVQVQGESAVPQIVRAIEWFNAQADVVDTLVLIRGGGSADDLQSFSSEQVTRAVAASRIPTLVAIGHEVDVSLAELAADLRASTPSNAAELLVPDKQHELARLQTTSAQLGQSLQASVTQLRHALQTHSVMLHEGIESLLGARFDTLQQKTRLLQALSPQRTLERGYAIVSTNGKAVMSVAQLKKDDTVSIRFKDASAEASILSTE